MNENNSSSERLKTLLKTLFQFDATELDFGIYGIMNYKRSEIEEFIFGFENFSDLKEKLKGTIEGFGNDGTSYFADAIIGWEKLKNPSE